MYSRPSWCRSLAGTADQLYRTSEGHSAKSWLKPGRHVEKPVEGQPRSRQTGWRRPSNGSTWQTGRDRKSNCEVRSRRRYWVSQRHGNHDISKQVAGGAGIASVGGRVGVSTKRDSVGVLRILRRIERVTGGRGPLSEWKVKVNNRGVGEGYKDGDGTRDESARAVNNKQREEKK